MREERDDEKEKEQEKDESQADDRPSPRVSRRIQESPDKALAWCFEELHCRACDYGC